MKNSLRLSGNLPPVGILLLLFAGIQVLSATTLVVGNCKSGGGYPTIQQAINAAPVGATVQVCPGNHTEQVTITQAVTLQGIIINNGDKAMIGTGGQLVANATDLFGDRVAAQVLVQNSAGPVNISNLEINGLVANTVALVVGIYYQNSPGTINGVNVTGQNGNGLGIGIFLEGGASSPTVTVQNSHISDFDYAGIDFETINHPNTALKAKITNNYVEVPASDGSTTPTGIQFGLGTTATVSGNTLIGQGAGSAYAVGIYSGKGASGSVSSNSVSGIHIGIQLAADGVSVTSNKVSGYSLGIVVQTSIGAVKSNIVTGSLGAPMNSTGIHFDCNTNLNVLSNTINFTNVGLDTVPTGLNTSTNKVFNTDVVRSGGC